MKTRKITKLTRVIRERRLTGAEAETVRLTREDALREAPALIARFRARQAAQKLLADAKRIREAQQLTLQQVAEKIGMDASNVAKLENGQRENPTLESLFRIADALGKRVELTLKDK